MRQRSSKEMRAIHAKGKGPVRKSPRVKAGSGYRTDDGWSLRMKKTKKGRPFYFFARSAGVGRAAAMPPGFQVVRNNSTGLPFLARVDKGQEEALVRAVEARS